MFIHILLFIYNFSCFLKVFIVGNSLTVIVIGVLCQSLRAELSGANKLVQLDLLVRAQKSHQMFGPILLAC